MSHTLVTRALEVWCPECHQDAGSSCAAVSYGFAGRGPKRIRNRMRAPHPERMEAAEVAVARAYAANPVLPMCDLCARGHRREAGVHVPTQRVGMIPAQPCTLAWAVDLSKNDSSPGPVDGKRWVAYWCDKHGAHQLKYDNGTTRRFSTARDAASAARRKLPDFPPSCQCDEVDEDDGDPKAVHCSIHDRDLDLTPTTKGEPMAQTPKSAAPAEGEFPHLSTDPRCKPLWDWLNEHRASCMWTQRVIAPKSTWKPAEQIATIECWRAGSGVVLVQVARHGWSVYTESSSNDPKITLADAWERLQAPTPSSGEVRCVYVRRSLDYPKARTWCGRVVGFDQVHNMSGPLPKDYDLCSACCSAIGAGELLLANPLPEASS